MPSRVDVALRVLTQDLLRRENVYQYEGEKAVRKAFEILRDELADGKEDLGEESSELEKVAYFEERAVDKIIHDKN